MSGDGQFPHVRLCMNARHCGSAKYPFMMEPSNPLELVKNMRKKMQPLSLSRCGFFHHGTPSSGRTLASSWPTDFSLAEDMSSRTVCLFFPPKCLPFKFDFNVPRSGRNHGTGRILLVNQPDRPESHQGNVAAHHVSRARVQTAAF